jgi:chondroitin-sulfate-ABC endolyase/exolyase
MATKKESAVTVSAVIEFGPKLPDNLKSNRDNIGISGPHGLFVKHTLEWNWRPGDTLTIRYPLSLENEITAQGTVYAPVFAFYIYNPAPVKFPLTIQFGQGNDAACGFTFNLDFTGWRTAWVRYTDMTGEPHPNMDFIRFTAPSAGQGKFFIGPIVPCQRVYQALPMADAQVPFVVDGEEEHRGPGADRSHLKVMRIKAPEYQASAADLADLKKVEDRLQKWLIAEYLPPHGTFEKYYRRFAKLGYAKFNATSHNKYLYFGIEFNIFPSEYRNKYNKSSLNIALTMRSFVILAAFYHTGATPEQKAELAKDILHLYRLMKLQGWMPGHARGSLHNTGYQVKALTATFYLMRQVFAEAGLLPEIAALTQWLTNAKEVALMPAGEHESSLDYFHTFALEQLTSLLLTPDVNQRVYWTKTFAESLSMRLSQQVNNDEDGFKYDGTAFHHLGHYPDYAWGAFEYAAVLVNLFSGTEFQICRAGHENLKRALLSARVYTNKYDLPNTLLGRHPFTGGYSILKKPDIKNALWNLTLAGTPDGRGKLDPECAAAYLRFFEHSRAVLSENIKKLKDAGFSAENSPNGFWGLNNGGVAILRRDEWMVVFKGYSKYVWLGEGWTVANRYGAFLSHGAMEIILPGGPAKSGYRQNGWDWTRIPGTTTLHAPLEMLLASLTPHKNKRSRETFCGAVDFAGKYGVFGLKINDDFFDVKAKKSYFCFGRLIVALGSDLSSRNAHYKLETTIFQNYLPRKDTSVWLNSPVSKVSRFPDGVNISTVKNSDIALGDAYGNSYFIRQGNLIMRRQRQQSKTQNKGLDTQGNFATAWLEHGARVKDVSYHYAVLIQAGNNEVNKFIKRLKSQDDQPYQVIQHDGTAHIVHDNATGLIGAAVFESGKISHPRIVEVSHEVLLMTREDNGRLDLSICEPDLKWDYRNPDTKVLVTLNGKWTIGKDSGNAIIIGHSSDKTYLQITCSMGKSSCCSLSSIR